MFASDSTKTKMAVNSKFKIPTPREVLTSIPIVRREWKSKTPMQKWCYFYSIGKIPMNFVRVSLFSENLHDQHWLAYFMYTYLGAAIALSSYTLYYYQSRGELQTGLISTCMAGLTVGHFPITIAMVSKTRFKLQSLIDFGGRYIYHDSHESTKHNRICSKQMDVTMRRFLIKMGTIFVSFLFGLVGPLQAYFVHGIKTTTTEMRMPFCEPKSDAEFMGNFLLQNVIAAHGILLYIGIETFLSIFENVVTVAPRLIRGELVKTIQLFEDKLLSEVELRLRIKRIVELSQDTDNYVSSLSDIFHWRNLFTPVAFTYLIGMSIFCQYTTDFTAGYGIAAMSLVQLFFVCELGENIQDNGFADMLFQTKWEVLPPTIQKVLMLLIHRKQCERGLKLGPFGTGINREFFKLATNKIYTFIMFLLNFFY